MKKIIYSMLAVMVLTISISGFNTAISNPDGAPAGRTGSPGDGGATCQASGCHSGSPATVANIITSNVPVTGYVPATTYTITVTVTGTGKKGFQVSPQNTAGTLLGTLTAGTGTKIVSTKYVTHTSAKNTSSAVWTFQWKAPAAGTGNVTFYGAFAITTGTTKKSTLVLKEDVPLTVAPTLVSFLPTSAASGQTVTLNGHKFTNATGVTFGGVSATSFTVTNDSTISAVVPSNAISGSVMVTNLVGSSTVAGFTFVAAPSLVSFLPTTAIAGEAVTLTGHNFTNASAVTFGGVNATSYTVTNDSVISAIVSANAASGSVVVTTPAGSSTATGFTFIAAPTMSAFAPTAAHKNDTITITGTNFSNASAVIIGGMPAVSFSVINSTTIKAVIDSCMNGSVEVTTIAGTTQLAGFTFIPRTVGINFEKNSFVKVYPNPTSDVLFIKNLGLDKIQKVEVYNVSGQLVLISKNTSAVELNSLSAGKYFVVMTTATKSYKETVIKK